MEKAADKDYTDIMDYPHPVSWTHAPIAMSHRAAQFAPFAALTGYDGVIEETARRIILDESSQAALDEALKNVAADMETQSCVRNRRRVTILYFKEDEAKTGGSYEWLQSRIRQIDSGENCLILENRMKLPLSDIYDIHFSG